MKKKITVLLILFFSLNIVYSQQWMNSLEMAKRLALSNDKMVLMVWEESVLVPYPAIIKDENGKQLFIKNMFDDESVSEVFWNYFVPVIVSDHLYPDLYEEVKGKRKSYIDKFNDDGFKILDANGTIINTNPITEEYLDLTSFIKNYGLNTKYLEQELRNYRKEKDFYSAFYLADRYIDYATRVNKKVTSEFINLSSVYLNEAKDFLERSELENKPTLMQRCELLELKQYLVQARPRKVLRELERMEKDPGIEKTNESLKAFLYFTAYFLVNDEENADKWKSEVSLVDLKKVQAIVDSTIGQRK
ncbi:hypothetical protein [Winogradskyella sp. A3E31]|uniref:hypothetical protein n=1 Tax=Winogradskyella sp. A3E31 TaxID=3349637 RepID=UPI00398BB255